MADIIEAIDRNMKSSGKAYILYPESRQLEAAVLLNKKNMKLDKIRDISSVKKIKVNIYRIKKND